MSFDKNYVDLTGNITRDSEAKYTSAGMAIVRFSLAVNDSHKKSDGSWENVPSYIVVNAFGKLAERICVFTKKGQRVNVCGKFKQSRWTDNNGKEHMQIVVNADSVDPIQRSDSFSQPAQPSSYSTHPNSIRNDDGSIDTPPDFEGDDIPF